MKFIRLLFVLMISCKTLGQTDFKTQSRSVTLETLRSLYDPQLSNFYIKFDNLYSEFDLRSPHTLNDIHKVMGYDDKFLNQAKDQAYQFFKKLDYVGVLKEGGSDDNFNCELKYYFTIINYITSDGQMITYKLYISRQDIEKNIDSFNRTDFLLDLKRLL